MIVINPDTGEEIDLEEPSLVNVNMDREVSYLLFYRKLINSYITDNVIWAVKYKFKILFSRKYFQDWETGTSQGQLKKQINGPNLLHQEVLKMVHFLWLKI